MQALRLGTVHDYQCFNMQKQKIKNLTKKGFSLVEILLSLFLLSAGLTATARMMLTGYKNSIDGRNAVVASELVQEGLEIVRNHRDNNIAIGRAAFNGLTTNANFACPHLNVPANSVVDGSTTSSLMQCPDATYQVYYQRIAPGNGFTYNSASAEKTLFRRRVAFLDNTSNPRTLRSVVIWGNATFASMDANMAQNCVPSRKCIFADLRLNSDGWK